MEFLNFRESCKMTSISHDPELEAGETLKASSTNSSAGGMEHLGWRFGFGFSFACPLFDLWQEKSPALRAGPGAISGRITQGTWCRVPSDSFSVRRGFGVARAVHLGTHLLGNVRSLSGGLVRWRTGCIRGSFPSRWRACSGSNSEIQSARFGVLR